jgi:hypothetical protein
MPSHLLLLLLLLMPMPTGGIVSLCVMCDV